VLYDPGDPAKIAEFEEHRPQLGNHGFLVGQDLKA